MNIVLRSRHKNAIHDNASKIRRTSMMNPSTPLTTFTKFVLFDSCLLLVDVDEISLSVANVIIAGVALIPVQISLASYS